MNSLDAAERDLLARVVEKADLQPFFFKKAKGLKWFDNLESLGFFKPDRNPSPVPAKEKGYVNIPLWPAAEYLASASENLRDKENKEYAKRFLEIIRGATRHAMQNNVSNYRTWWQFAKVMRNIPVDLIDVSDVELIDYWLQDPYDRSLIGTEVGAKWLDDLLDRDTQHTKKLALSLLAILFKTEETVDGRRSRGQMFRFTEWHAEKISAKIANKAGRKLGIEASQVFQGHLQNALSRARNDEWSTVWRRAVEDHEQDEHNDDVESILVSTFRDALLGFIDTQPLLAVPYVDSLLQSPFETIKRIAIFAMNERFIVLNSLVEKVLVPSFFASNFRHEQWHLLNKHYSAFSGAQKELVIQIITAHEERDEDGELSKGRTAYWQSLWLAALRHHEARANALYEQAVSASGTQPEHPDFSTYMTSGPVIHRSPFSMEDLLALPVKQLVERLNSVKDDREFGEPGMPGLAKTFRQLIKTEPLRFSLGLRHFLASDLGYVYELIEGYHELWSQKVTLPWDDIWKGMLDFLHVLVQSPALWDPANAERRRSFVANRYWIVGAVARFIEAGVKTDDHAFAAELLPRAENIVMTLLEKEKGEDFEDVKDAVSVAMNSPRGQVLEALVNLTLRSCRIEDKAVKTHRQSWSRFADVYKSELTKADEFEFPTLMASYLPNFIYMSQEWTIGSLPLLFDSKNAKRWSCAIQGYAYVGQVHEEIYSFLKVNGDFLRALDNGALDDRVHDKVIQNIAVGYLSDYERLADESSLIGQLLLRKKESELSHLIWYIWTYRDSKEESVREKVFSLWPQIIVAADTNTVEGRKIASKLCTWIAFIREIDEDSRKLILKIAPFADEDHNAFELLEAIARISERQPNDAYEIWMKVLEGSHPDYPDEALRTALTNIAKFAGLRSAKNIADKYIKAGNDKPAEMLLELSAH